jgi:aminoglycoside phosphotransferase (APT) family kinase protein
MGTPFWATDAQRAALIERPWDAEVMAGLDQARALIQAQFPQLTPLELAPYGEGWDNTAYLVNGTWVFRFPRRQIGADAMENELCILPRLAGRLPLAIPDPVFLGRPAGNYPWSFGGYRRLPGTTACHAALTLDQRLYAASRIGRFLRFVHAFGPEDARNLGADVDRLGRLDASRLLTEGRERLDELQRLGLISSADSLYRRFEADSAARSPAGRCLVHGDFYVRHLLVDARYAPCGVIDWGDVHLGDPALDLHVAHSFFPPSTHAAFLSGYGPVDEATWRLARFRGLHIAAAIALYGHHTGDADLEREGLCGLENILSQPE